MAWAAEEALEGTSCAARASTNYLLWAGPLEAAADCQCPICLGDTENVVYVVFYLHHFCFASSSEPEGERDVCLLCRQSLEQVLHSVRVDDN